MHKLSLANRIAHYVIAKIITKMLTLNSKSNHTLTKIISNFYSKELDLSHFIFCHLEMGAAKRA